ncbi:MAG: DNA topoisomerase III [Verrucomicrobiales bacterium]
MSKLLIIAEKPSVATDLARVLAKAKQPGSSQTLGKFERKGRDRNTYFENDHAVITSAVGHLVELKMPAGPNGKSLPWNFDVLPAIPKKFELQPIEKSESRLKLVLRLARRKDIDLIINACDAGREGELIFQYILDLGGIDKPVKRLWMQSMTQGAILQAWEKLRPAEAMKNLSDAAKCRSESDWLVGLNSTRALTCFRSRHGGFNITSAGRVQTPTLTILAKREKEIQAFQSTPYAELHAEFDVAAGTYPARWIDPAFKKDEKNPHARPERLWDPKTADAILARCQGKTGTVNEESKPTKQIAPQLYDLTTIQREAPFTAKNTLALAQTLYERHKMLTYPRTDSRYLPEDYLQNVIQTTKDLADSGHPVAQWAADSIKNDRIKFNKRVFNNAKVSDHFAIIPTGRVVKLNDAEAKLYDMVVKRFIAVFFPHAEFEVTKRLTTINPGAESDTFRTDGKILTSPGWLAVYGRQTGVASGKDELCAVTNGEDAKNSSLEKIDKETQPPARFTESTLLSAMEGAGKLLEDDELREAMAERGLGTPATRAAIIETLLRQKYIAREGRDLHVTPNGLRLIQLLEEMEIKPLTSPSMTGDWESKLRQMEQGNLARDSFMREIIGFTEDIVARAKKHRDELVDRSFPDLKVACPMCGAQGLRQTDATYECREPDCKFKAKKHIASRTLTEAEATELFTKKFVGPLSGFKSRFNRPFDAGLELDEKCKVNFVFDKDDDDEMEFTDDNLLTTVTLANGQQAKIHESEKAYHLPSLTSKQNPDGVRIGKEILKQEITPAQLEKMFTAGKTDLLHNFVSNRTKRKFSARLALDQDSGKINFEFEPRKKAAAKKGAKKKSDS